MSFYGAQYGFSLPQIELEILAIGGMDDFFLPKNARKIEAFFFLRLLAHRWGWPTKTTARNSTQRKLYCMSWPKSDVVASCKTSNICGGAVCLL